MAWNWRGVAVALLIGGAYFGYTKYSETANMCGRTETADIVAKILDQNQVGHDAKLTNISTLKTDGNETFCSSTFSYVNLAGVSVSKDGIEYQVHPTDDRKSIYVQIPGTSMYRLKE